MLLQQLDDRMDFRRDWMKNYKFHLVDSVSKLSRLVDVCAQRKRCALDLETTGVDNRVYPDSYFEDGRVTRHGMRTVDRIAGVCLSFDGQNGYYVPVGHIPEDSGNLPWDEAWEEITRLVNNCQIIFHNAKFDCEFLYPVTGKDYWKLSEYEDTYLMSKVISPLKQHPSGLKPLSKLKYDVELIEIDELFTPEKLAQLKRDKQGYNFAVLHPKEGYEYGCQDGIFTYKLRDTLMPLLSESDMKIYDLEKSFCNVIRELERNRVHVDVKRVEHLRTECSAEMLKVGDTIKEVIEKNTGRTGKWLTLNVGAVKQLSEALITDPEGLKLKPTAEMLAEANGEHGGGDGGGGDSDDDEDEDEEQKQYSLKDEALKSLHRVYGSKFSVQREGHVDKDGNPKKESIFELILEWRHYQKMNGSYLNPLSQAVDKYGDVRPNFSQVGTDTTRLSSKAGKIADGYSGINFQGIPRDSDEDKPELFKQLRTCIIPREGKVLVKLDYAGEELRVVTNLSGDPIWTKSFLYEDGDVHSITARTLFGKASVNKDERNRGKRCNFAFIYGGGAGAIQRNIGCDIQEASRHMENLRNDVPILMGYVEHQKAYARKHKCIFTAFGRRIPIPTIDSQIRGIRAKAERCAINYTIQATSADVLKFAMCWVDKNLRRLGWKDRCRYVLTVHDEVVYEVSPEHLMEVVRKLDEWMTEPWKLPKAHGRAWEVPLLTEPGIDFNWKARYDYFAMVDGAPVDPKDIAEDGTYKGKLKKDQYFADGRVYQKVPDFLEKWIHRLPVKKAGTAQEEPPSEQPPSEPPAPHPAEPEPEPIPEPAPAPEPEVAVVEEKTAPVPRYDIALLPREPSNVAEKAETPVSEPPPPSEPAPASSPSSSTKSSLGISEDDLDVDLPAAKPAEPPKASALPQDDVLDPDFGAAAEAIMADTPKKAPASKPNGAPKANGSSSANGTPQAAAEDGAVVRMVLRCVMNRKNMRKLHAVCILAEGSDPLRVVDRLGNIVVPESSGVTVNAATFNVLVSLFGLG